MTIWKAKMKRAKIPESDTCISIRVSKRSLVDLRVLIEKKSKLAGLPAPAVGSYLRKLIEDHAKGEEK